MAFAGVNCQNELDELALINWRATRLAGVLGALDSAARFPAKAPSAPATRSCAPSSWPPPPCPG